ncbi:Glutamine-dependent NAD(+) synthetase [Marinobacterium sp. xm-a-127]|nr:Glutamine-dependent NAD(+) synthetase [Marinobacterium sp. xm-d-420]NRP56505.1 Glutamine-dependent NAD(+) synthetase [Marinobacterium sp. xm-d-510]NRP96706.1 Glutamine-dependent NAD(+) synthetase [Marinobacterium sp. xm-a-127]
MCVYFGNLFNLKISDRFMSQQLVVALAQINFLVGDIPGNTQKMIDAAMDAASQGDTDIIVFSELSITGYPPEDLLLRPSLKRRVDEALNRLKTEVRGIALLVGYPAEKEGELRNMAAIIEDGEVLIEYAKQHLPNYRVFDEDRYFEPHTNDGVFEYKGHTLGLQICADIWEKEPTQRQAEAGVKAILVPNASPYHMGKTNERTEVLQDRATTSNAPIVYVNQVGAQDELVFDGGSQVVDSKGQLAYMAPHHEEGVYKVSIDLESGAVEPLQPSTPEADRYSMVYQTLVMGVRDYVNKNGFKGVVFGLSGGIDSALTAAVAVDALGPDRVECVMMPFKYTSSISVEDAALEAEALGIRHSVISIEPMYEAFMQELAGEFAGTEVDATEENLQARCRGVLLMAISNKKGYLVLTTSNKSETAVGYSTLYGDMAGGFCVLKDIPKTLVYELSRYRNTISPVIPERVITRPPSAELRPDQTDQDSLPDYDQLDAIIEMYVEHDYSAEMIIAEGYNEADVLRVIRLIDINEYKRRQAPIGTRITNRGFGRDRRYPITSGWKAGV